jgi:hypothetical protein
MDELFILTPVLRVRNNCRVDARATYESGGFQPSCPPGATHAPRRDVGARAGTAHPSASGPGRASDCDPAPGGDGHRSHRGGQEHRADAGGFHDRRADSDLIEPTARRVAAPGRPAANSRRCPRRRIESAGAAPRLPRTSRRILVCLTPAQGRVKQASHSRSSRPPQGVSAPDASAGLLAARRGLPVPTAYR